MQKATISVTTDGNRTWLTIKQGRFVRGEISIMQGELLTVIKALIHNYREIRDAKIFDAK